MPSVFSKHCLLNEIWKNELRYFEYSEEPHLENYLLLYRDSLAAEKVLAILSALCCIYCLQNQTNKTIC